MKTRPKFCVGELVRAKSVTGLPHWDSERTEVVKIQWMGEFVWAAEPGWAYKVDSMPEEVVNNTIRIWYTEDELHKIPPEDDFDLKEFVSTLNKVEA